MLDSGGNLITEIPKDHDNLYTLPPVINYTAEPRIAAANMVSETRDLWHNRLGHINDHDLNSALENSVTGIKQPAKIRRPSPISPCDGCMLGKMPRGNIQRTSESSTTRPLEIIHSDISGPFPVDGIHGKSRYYISILDQHTRYSFVYL
ncbi:hypothetical protein B5P40_32040, partial [Bacillus sp. SRB_8]